MTRLLHQNNYFSGIELNYWRFTGKTMVARILGKLLHMVGILPTDKVTEVQRTDLVGEFVGHTGPKTRRVVLFISSFAYALSVSFTPTHC